MSKLLTLKHLSQKFHKSFSPTYFHHHSFRTSHSLSKTTTHFLSPPHQCQSPITTFHGFFSNPLLAKHFGSTAHFKNPMIKRLVGPTVKSSPWASTQRRRWSSSPQEKKADTTINIILGLIVANTAVFMMWQQADKDFMEKNFTISVDNIRSGRIHTMITYAFSHISPGHLASNMIGLYCFGFNIGKNFGPEYFLKLYFAGAVFGATFGLVYHGFLQLAKMFKEPGTGGNTSETRIYGASGAVNALVLLHILLFPKATIFFDFFIPVPAMLVGIYLIGSDVLRIIQGDTRASGSTHLGGAAVGAAAWLRLMRRRRGRV